MANCIALFFLVICALQIVTNNEAASWPCCTNNKKGLCNENGLHCEEATCGCVEYIKYCSQDMDCLSMTYGLGKCNLTMGQCCYSQLPCPLP
ncbi:hypothetical protein DdX_12685 [Ditylenchus destructor]|uniref:Uncharacterized protein n=1 Tax=Ditylenchus destructor TaxID=166010 RepID=A0AAD4MVA0_9BILA|nr:hypothetical protein DdX_12685 [Ditylenchus destructor]